MCLELSAHLETKELSPLRRWLLEKVQDDSVLMKKSSLIPHWKTKNRYRFLKKEFSAVTEQIEKWGYGIEPDLGTETPIPEAKNKIVIFRFPQKNVHPVKASRELNEAKLLLFIAYYLRVVKPGTDQGKGLCRHLSKTYSLSANEESRLSAYLLWLQKTESRFETTRKRFKGLSTNQKDRINWFSIAMSLPDLGPGKMLCLISINPALGFPMDFTFERLDSIGLGRKKTVQSPPHPEPHPPGRRRPVDLGNKTPLNLDNNRIEKIIEETKTVTNILSEVFSANDKEHDIPLESFQEPSSENGILGLDTDHTGLYTRLIQKPVWEKVQFRILVKQSGLLPDGAIETINDAFFEHFGDSLIESSDTIILNQELITEATKASFDSD